MIRSDNDGYNSLAGHKRNCPVIGFRSVYSSNLSATNEDPEHPIRNVWNPDTYTFWRAENRTDTDVYINLNYINSEVNYIAIAGQNFSASTAKYTVQVSPDNATWSDLFSEVTVYDSGHIFHLFNSVVNQYFRLRLRHKPVLPAAEPIATRSSISHIKLGRSLILEHPMYVGFQPPRLNPKSTTKTNNSQTGNYLGEVVTRRWYEASCSQKNSDPYFVRNEIYPFVQHTQNQRGDFDNGTYPTGPFFYAWRPFNDPEDVIYGWVTGDVQITNQLSNGMMEFNFDMQGSI